MSERDQATISTAMEKAADSLEAVPDPDTGEFALAGSHRAQYREAIALEVLTAFFSSSEIRIALLERARDS